MAFVRPSLVVDTTNTSGTGSYTLVNGDPGDGFRNLADAVTDGDAANADTISYFVVDTTTKGATLQWEHGTGTISGGGTTLARTTIIESSNGDAAVSWGVGGTRTIRFGAGTAGFAQLAAANTFTGTNIFTTSIAVDSAGSAQNIDVGSDLTTGTLGRLRFMGHNASAADVNYAALSATAVSAVAGSEQGRLNITIRTAGTPTVIADIDTDGLNVLSGTLQQAGTNVALQGVLSAPSGCRLLIGNASVPSGWTIVAGLADRTIMLTSTIGEVDDTGGSWTSGISASTTVNGHALTIAEMPSHDHVAEFLDAGGVQAAPAWRTDGTTATVFTNDVLNTGSGNAHSHTASTTINSTSYRPAYYKGAFIAKT